MDASLSESLALKTSLPKYPYFTHTPSKQSLQPVELYFNKSLSTSFCEEATFCHQIQPQMFKCRSETLDWKVRGRVQSLIKCQWMPQV